jgi:hypothetical protein
MLAALLAMLAELTVRSRFNDPDMWWHLKTGERIWTMRAIPTTDTFAYTTNHHAYVPHEWLSQLLLYVAYHTGGYSGMMVGLCLLTAAVMIAGYMLCSAYSENLKVGFAGAMVIWLFASSGLALRPQMIGYLLLIVEMLFLHMGRARDARWFLALPPLFAVWVNCHGSFFLGFLAAAIVWFSSCFEFRAGSLIAIPWITRRRQMLGLALLLCLPALFVNPIGVKQVLYPLNTLLHQPIGLSMVDEWQPLQMGEFRALALLAVLGCIALLVIVRRTELRWDELLLLMLGTWLAASHRRMLFVFGILAAPVLSRLLSDLWEGYVIEHDRPLPNAVMIAAAILLMVFAFPKQQYLAQQVEERSPVKAVQYIRSNNLQGRMLNEYVYGGYLIWTAPEHPVFVDGRSDVFEQTGVLDDFAKWAMLQSSPAKLLDDYRIDFCLLARDSPMSQVLPLLPNWEQVYSDTNSVIFVRKPGREAT